jgi:hypothetical protein
MASPYPLSTTFDSSTSSTIPESEESNEDT